jgi:hypothetical protein
MNCSRHFLSRHLKSRVRSGFVSWRSAGLPHFVQGTCIGVRLCNLNPLQAESTSDKSAGIGPAIIVATPPQPFGNRFRRTEASDDSTQRRDSKGCCDRLSRRSFLQLGAAGLTTLGLPQLFQAREAAAKAGAAAKDTRVILLWLEGGPSHIDLWDMKPSAPAEYRGYWRPIPTNVAGMQITEMFPRQAKLADKFSIVRSLHHGDTDHIGSPHIMLTGRVGPTIANRRPRALDGIHRLPHHWRPRPGCPRSVVPGRRRQVFRRPLRRPLPTTLRRSPATRTARTSRSRT